MFALSQTNSIPTKQWHWKCLLLFFIFHVFLFCNTRTRSDELPYVLAVYLHIRLFFSSFFFIIIISKHELFRSILHCCERFMKMHTQHSNLSLKWVHFIYMFELYAWNANTKITKKKNYFFFAFSWIFGKFRLSDCSHYFRIDMCTIYTNIVSISCIKQ